MSDALEGLSPLERGVVLGALMAGERGACRLEGLAASLADRCRAALDQLDGSGRVDRRAAIQRLTHDLARPSMPARLDGVDRSWCGGVDVARLPASSAGRLLSYLRLRLPFPLRAPPADETTAELLSWPIGRLHVALRRFALLVFTEVARRAGAQHPRDLPGMDHLLPDPYPEWLERAARSLPPVTDEPWAVIGGSWPAAVDLARNARGQPEHAMLALGAVLAAAALELPARSHFVLALPVELGRALTSCDLPGTGCPALVELVLAADGLGQGEGN